MKEGREKKEINKNKVRCPGEKKGREERKGEGQKENMKGKRRKGGRKRRKTRCPKAVYGHRYPCPAVCLKLL